MSWFTLITIIIVLGFLLFCGLLIGHPWIVQDYPKHIEEQEELELIKKVKEYKKSQE